MNPVLKSAWPGSLIRIRPLTALSGEKLSYAFLRSPFGPILIASTETGICSIRPADDRGTALAALQKQFPGVLAEPGSQALYKELSGFFEGETVHLVLHVKGTDFQLKVWNALLQIPLGSTTTYGAIAEAISHPGAFRAVGTAVGANPIFCVVPCHRVLPATGGIGNYYWGPQLKKELLDWEAGRMLCRETGDCRK